MLELIEKNADQFSDANNVIDLIVNMAPHQSGSIPIHSSLKNSFSMHDDGDILSGNKMKGQRGRFSFDGVKGTGESHKNISFTNALGTFLREFQNGANNNVINDFVKKMKSQYGIDVTVN